MSNVQISQINIIIGEKEISLSLDEARELHQILSQTLKPVEAASPERVIERIIEHYNHYNHWNTPSIRYNYASTLTTGGNVGSIGKTESKFNGLTVTLSSNKSLKA